MESTALENCDTLPEGMIDVTYAKNGAWRETWLEGDGNDQVVTVLRYLPMRLIAMLCWPRLPCMPARAAKR